MFIAVNDSGDIIRSRDKGESWSFTKFDTNIGLYKINMLDKDYGIMGGCYGLCEKQEDVAYFYTNDGGITWVRMNKPKDLSISNFDIINKELFVTLDAVKNDSGKYEMKLIKVRDNGDIWDTISCPSSTYIEFIDMNRGWITGGEQVLDSAGWESWSQKIFYTEDGGKTWEKQRDTVYNGSLFRDIEFYDENFGIAGSDFYHVAITTNGGKTWKDEKVDYRPPNSGATDAVYNINIVNSHTAFAIVNFNSVYKYTRPTTDIVDEVGAKDGISIRPNPAEDYIEINLGVIGGSSGEIVIWDVFGRKLTALSSPFNSPASGGHIKIDVSGLAAGLYFVRIGAEVRKFLKL